MQLSEPENSAHLPGSSIRALQQSVFLFSVWRKYVEAGQTVSLIDRGKVSGLMQVPELMPVIPDHNILFIPSAVSYEDKSTELLAQTMQQTFRFEKQMSAESKIS